jgi:hypothetical protein
LIGSMSSPGAPSSSAITSAGSGNANSATKSNSPRAVAASISASIAAWIRGRLFSSWRGVNAFWSSARSRV